MSLREILYEGFLWIAAGTLIGVLATQDVLDKRTTSTLVATLVGAVSRQFGSTWTRPKDTNGGSSPTGSGAVVGGE